MNKSGMNIYKFSLYIFLKKLYNKIIKIHYRGFEKNFENFEKTKNYNLLCLILLHNTTQ